MHLSFAIGLFWTSVACCLIAQFSILRSVLGARHVAEPSANLPRSRGSVELLWAVAPAVGLVVLLAFTWRAIEQREARAPSPATTEGITR